MTEITRGWPPKRRQKQAKNIRKTKPWKKATGPKTTEGKETMRYNAIKHGLFTPEGQAFRTAIKAQGEILKLL
ncbi:MAG: hypothetical protein DHS20C02_04650 [Micavibrio sp.]|nr:MAG: hypothetical protein DHS20C02_04650 [Micavibrio sp.]